MLMFFYLKERKKNIIVGCLFRRLRCIAKKEPRKGQNYFWKFHRGNNLFVCFVFSFIYFSISSIMGYLFVFTLFIVRYARL